MGQGALGAYFRVVLLQVGVVLVSLRDEDHEGLLCLHTRAHEQLGHMVQVGGVALGRVAQRQQLGLAAPPDGVAQGVLARGHPIQVALHRVDLSCSITAPVTVSFQYAT
jgi:hypothetical protein